MKEYSCSSKSDDGAIAALYSVLDGLESYSGIARIQINGFCDSATYNQATKTWEKVTFLKGGYRPDSLSTTRPLSTQELDELHQDIKRGGIELQVCYTIAHKNAGFKDETIFKIHLAPRSIA